MPNEKYSDTLYGFQICPENTKIGTTLTICLSGTLNCIRGLYEKVRKAILIEYRYRKKVILNNVGEVVLCSFEVCLRVGSLFWMPQTCRQGK
jgi:hypothetical protein